MSASLLKDLYSPAFLNQFATLYKEVDKTFNTRLFLNRTMEQNWDSFALKQRQKHIARVWESLVSGPFEKKSAQMLQLVQHIHNQAPSVQSIEWMFIPEFYELFGRQYPKIAIPALAQVTQLVSCELAVRPYILDDPQRMMQQMVAWAQHPHYLVRRLASEGSRPRLPWAMALPFLKKDPRPTLPILDALKNDPAETVRRSVANHVNDIAKDHPNVVIELLDRWQNISPEVDWVRKHAARTLLKKAHPEVLSRFGLTSPTSLQTQLLVKTPVLPWQGNLLFEIQFQHLHPKELLLRIEFAIDYKKANGKQNRKVFKITERYYTPNQWFTYTREHSFIERTTRKHYPGAHSISLIINGKEVASTPFELQSPS